MGGQLGDAFLWVDPGLGGTGPHQGCNGKLVTNKAPTYNFKSCNRRTALGAPARAQSRLIAFNKLAARIDNPDFWFNLIDASHMDEMEGSCL